MESYFFLRPQTLCIYSAALRGKARIVSSWICALMFLSAASLHTFSLSIQEDEMSSLFSCSLPLQLSSSYIVHAFACKSFFSGFPVLPCENFLSIVPSEKITMWQYRICIIKRASAEDYVSVLMIDLSRCERGEGEENKSRLLSKLHLHKKWKSVAEERFTCLLSEDRLRAFKTDGDSWRACWAEDTDECDLSDVFKAGEREICLHSQQKKTLEMSRNSWLKSNQVRPLHSDGLQTLRMRNAFGQLTCMDLHGWEKW